MSVRRRFERLEKERPAGAPAPAGGASSSVESRFGNGMPPAAGTDAGRTRNVGASADRFRAEAPAMQVLDLESGQAFVRCVLCRGDNHATATTCCRCEAALDTPAQRAFNETFWKARQEEDAALRGEVELVAARREQADRAAAEARRYLDWMDHEIALRRQRRLGQELVIDLNPQARALGLAIGGLVRRFVLAVRASWRGPGR
jgi:hypothetical protein